jgi:hypothetical protein
LTGGNLARIIEAIGSSNDSPKCRIVVFFRSNTGQCFSTPHDANWAINWVLLFLFDFWRYPFLKPAVQLSPNWRSIRQKTSKCFI